MSASLIQRAFTYVRATDTDKRVTGQRIADYVRDMSTDRRYRLTFDAASSDFRSAIVTYRGTRYYVSHDYPTDTYTVNA